MAKVVTTITQDMTMARAGMMTTRDMTMGTRATMNRIRLNSVRRPVPT